MTTTLPCEFCGQPNIKGHHAHCQLFREHINNHRADIVRDYNRAGATATSVSKKWGIAKETVTKFVMEHIRHAVTKPDKKPPVKEPVGEAKWALATTPQMIEIVEGLVRNRDEAVKENSELKQRNSELEAKVGMLEVRLVGNRPERQPSRPELPYWMP